MITCVCEAEVDPVEEKEIHKRNKGKESFWITS
jgi:hypothetical protein